MRATRVEDEADELWEVHHGYVWWTVHFPDDGTGPVILNEKLIAIKPTGRLGKNILHAIKRAREAEQ